MATSSSLNEIKTKRGTWFVDTHADNIIGQGAYGIVYRGTDEKGNKIAAKRIDKQRKQKLTEKMKDLEKLMELDHPNIVKFHDIHEEEGVVWIFMDLCEHGDLNKFVRKKPLDQDQSFRVMKQIAEGVAYLHGNNVIHRDIKPENILVSSDSPISVKLTDFDVSKFFDKFCKTSAMSTNVGTLAYKAPEFFKRDEDGNLIYHRKIDVYSVGLTFLAIQQANETKRETKRLVPRIETARDDSELHVPSIGQLIVTRIKYRVPELNIVEERKKSSLMQRFRGIVGGSSGAAASDTGSYDMSTEIREIILKMTKASSEDRWSAARVVEALKFIEQNMMEAELARISLEEERKKEEERKEEEERKKEEDRKEEE